MAFNLLNSISKLTNPDNLRNINNIANNIGTAVSGTTLATLRNQFITNYGSIAGKYDDYLDAFGNQTNKTTYPTLMGVVGVVLTIVSFIWYSKSQQQPEEQRNKKKTANTFKKILSWILLIFTIGSFILAGYLYGFVYLPKKKDWFLELPMEAKGLLASIKALGPR